MSRLFATALIAGSILATLAAAPPAAAGQDRAQAALEVIQTVPRALGERPNLATQARRETAGRPEVISGEQQEAYVINCGETITTDITTQDFVTQSGVFFDIAFFDGVAGETVTITMTSTAFNPYLILFDPAVNVVAEDDDSGPGNAAQIVYVIDETSPDWSVTPTPLDPGVTGPYTLTLECSAPPPPPPPPPPADGFFTDPQYPDFRFKVDIEPAGQAPIEGMRLADCQEDTVCVAGAVPDRAELFIRILGPRPNGFLWPTLVRFTPSKVTAQIKQVSTGQTNTYVLDAVGPGDPDLSGTQDRMGFVP